MKKEWRLKSKGSGKTRSTDDQSPALPEAAKPDASKPSPPSGPASARPASGLDAARNKRPSPVPDPAEQGISLKRLRKGGAASSEAAAPRFAPTLKGGLRSGRPVTGTRTRGPAPSPVEGGVEGGLEGLKGRLRREEAESENETAETAAPETPPSPPARLPSAKAPSLFNGARPKTLDEAPPTDEPPKSPESEGLNSGLRRKVSLFQNDEDATRTGMPRLRRSTGDPGARPVFRMRHDRKPPVEEETPKRGPTVTVHERIRPVDPEDSDKLETPAPAPADPSQNTSDEPAQSPKPTKEPRILGPRALGSRVTGGDKVDQPADGQDQTVPSSSTPAHTLFSAPPKTGPEPNRADPAAPRSPSLRLTIPSPASKGEAERRPAPAPELPEDAAAQAEAPPPNARPNATDPDETDDPRPRLSPRRATFPLARSSGPPAKPILNLRLREAEPLPADRFFDALNRSRQAPPARMPAADPDQRVPESPSDRDFERPEEPIEAWRAAARQRMEAAQMGAGLLGPAPEDTDDTPESEPQPQMDRLPPFRRMSSAAQQDAQTSRNTQDAGPADDQTDDLPAPAPPLTTSEDPAGEAPLTPEEAPEAADAEKARGGFFRRGSWLLGAGKKQETDNPAKGATGDVAPGDADSPRASAARKEPRVTSSVTDTDAGDGATYTREVPLSDPDVLIMPVDPYMAAALESAGLDHYEMTLPEARAETSGQKLRRFSGQAAALLRRRQPPPTRTIQADTDPTDEAGDALDEAQERREVEGATWSESALAEMPATFFQPITRSASEDEDDPSPAQERAYDRDTADPVPALTEPPVSEAESREPDSVAPQFVEPELVNEAGAIEGTAAEQDAEPSDDGAPLPETAFLATDVPEEVQIAEILDADRLEDAEPDLETGPPMIDIDATEIEEWSDETSPDDEDGVDEDGVDEETLAEPLVAGETETYADADAIVPDMPVPNSPEPSVPVEEPQQAPAERVESALEEDDEDVDFVALVLTEEGDDGRDVGEDGPTADAGDALSFGTPTPQDPEIVVAEPEILDSVPAGPETDLIADEAVDEAVGEAVGAQERPKPEQPPSPALEDDQTPEPEETLADLLNAVPVIDDDEPAQVIEADEETPPRRAVAFAPENWDDQDKESEEEIEALAPAPSVEDPVLEQDPEQGDEPGTDESPLGETEDAKTLPDPADDADGDPLVLAVDDTGPEPDEAPAEPPVDASEPTRAASDDRAESSDPADLPETDQLTQAAPVSDDTAADAPTIDSDLHSDPHTDETADREEAADKDRQDPPSDEALPAVAAGLATGLVTAATATAVDHALRIEQDPDGDEPGRDEPGRDEPGRDEPRPEEPGLDNGENDEAQNNTTLPVPLRTPPPAPRPRRPSPVEMTWLQTTALLIGTLTIMRLFVIWVSDTNLVPDEAQYWSWAQDFAFGYFTKPPLLPWIIAGTTAVCGQTEACVRTASPLLYAATCLALFFLTRSMVNARTGFLVAATFATLPGVWFSSMIMTTDVPLLFCWSFALLALWQTANRAGVGWILVLGAALGLGILGKYAMVYFVIGMVLLTVFEPAARRALWPWRGVLALAIAGLIITPHVLWNMENGFATVSHTAANANWSGELFNIDRFGKFFVDQFGVFGPILFAALLWRLVTVRSGSSVSEPARPMAPGRRGYYGPSGYGLVGVDTAQKTPVKEDAAKASADAERPRTVPFLLCFILPPLLIVSVQAFISRAHANWAAAAYVAATILVVAWLSQTRRRWIMALSFLLHIVGGLVLSTMMLSPDLVDRVGRAKDFERMRGWNEVGAEVRWRALAGQGDRLFSTVLFDDRKTFAEMTYYYQRPVVPLSMWDGDGVPENHYEMNNPLTPALADFVLYVTRKADPSEVLERFDTVTPIDSLTSDLGNGRTRTFHFYALEGLRGTGDESEAEAKLAPLAPSTPVESPVVPQARKPVTVLPDDADTELEALPLLEFPAQETPGPESETLESEALESQSQEPQIEEAQIEEPQVQDPASQAPLPDQQRDEEPSVLMEVPAERAAPSEEPSGPRIPRPLPRPQG